MKVKGIPFNQVKETLLNTPEAIRGYQEADKELALVETSLDQVVLYGIKQGDVTDKEVRATQREMKAAVRTHNKKFQ
ncbi:hypothetical protein [Enterobacter asburiae]|uniref:hypothetical protein n=1 Tax=Enterobacter asburiae TaxID=61645 RepID=UPI001CBA8F42|nr:hypothetical protein [Enterobacter asburiae]UAN38789.1 hypothetical protein KGP18_23015 [Enterobacter asburiae]